MAKKEDKKTVEKIAKVIELIKAKFRIGMGYEYDPVDDVYFIWHNREDLEYESMDFNNYVPKVLYKYFFSEGYPNVCFSFDHTKVKETK